MHYRIQPRGYTLVELLIVISIIGVLSSIAIPFYQDYVARSQMTGPISLGGAYRVAIEDLILERGDFPDGEEGLKSVFGKLISDPADPTQVTFDRLDLISEIALNRNEENSEEGEMVISIEPDEEGTLGIKKDIRGKKITFTRANANWTCTTDASKDVTPKGCQSAT